MRKNTKRLLLGLVAVAILGGVYAGLMHMPDEQDTSSESKTLVSADADALSSIHVALSGGDDYTLTSTTKNKKTHPERLEMMKYNPVLKKHTLYKETKK